MVKMEYIDILIEIQIKNVRLLNGTKSNSYIGLYIINIYILYTKFYYRYLKLI